jgi:hypothetical protein
MSQDWLSVCIIRQMFIFCLCLLLAELLARFIYMLIINKVFDESPINS